MFESVHGSAPDIAGQGIANPIATVWAGAMMLEFLGENAAAAAVMNGIISLLQEDLVLTPDIGGDATTVEMGDAIRSQILS
jgi:tartrate dehydrogenase/decarboxylase/D-malate dehydrogenase